MLFAGRMRKEDPSSVRGCASDTTACSTTFERSTILSTGAAGGEEEEAGEEEDGGQGVPHAVQCDIH